MSTDPRYLRSRRPSVVEGAPIQVPHRPAPAKVPPAPPAPAVELPVVGLAGLAGLIAEGDNIDLGAAALRAEKMLAQLSQRGPGSNPSAADGPMTLSDLAAHIARTEGLDIATAAQRAEKHFATLARHRRATQ